MNSEYGNAEPADRQFSSAPRPNDPRNPGAPGIPGANPGTEDPGQYQPGGRNETPEQKQTPAEDKSAIDRWSGEGGAVSGPRTLRLKRPKASK
jgi:hypothetical protein